LMQSKSSAPALLTLSPFNLSLPPDKKSRGRCGGDIMGRRLS
jgi:hypothetical protein